MINKTTDGFQKFPDSFLFLSNGQIKSNWNKNEIEENFYSYLSAETKFESLLKKSQGNIIKDRNWISLFLFHLTLIKFTDDQIINNSIRVIIENIKNKSLTIPDFMIFLICPPKVTKIRRLIRQSNEWGDVPPWIPLSEKESFRKLRYHLYISFARSYPLANKLILDYKNIDMLKILDELSFENSFHKKEQIISFLYNFTIQNS